MRKRLFEDRVFYRDLVRLTFPIAFQSLMLALVAAGDAAMLGRLDQNSMSAVSLATQIQFIQNMVLYAVTSALTILGAQYWGKGDRGTVEKLIGLSLRTAGGASLLFAAACVGIPQVLMRIFTNEPELARIGAEYLRIAGWSYLLTGISQCLLALMKFTGHAGRSSWISSGAVVLNILLNAVFIFGLGGIPPMGARGAALATLIARAIELAASVLSSMQKGYIRPGVKAFFSRDRLLAADFRRCALPLLGTSLLWGVGFTAYTAIMGHLGTDAAAATSVGAVVRDLMCCLCNGISSAGGILVGRELGKGDLAKGKLYGNRLNVISWLCGLLSAGIVLASMPFVLRYMSLTDTARRYLVGILVMVAVYMIGRSVNTIVINGVFAAGGDTIFDLYSVAVTMWGIVMPLSLLAAFVFRWPVLAVYACTCLDEVGKLPWVMAHHRRYKWVRDLTRPAPVQPAPDSAL